MRRLRIEVRDDEAGRRLDEVLGLRLAGSAGLTPAKSRVRALIMSGALWHAGRPLRRPGRLVALGERFDLALHPGSLEQLAPPRWQVPAFGEQSVLYEDRWLIAVDKPAGLPTVATADPARPCLVSVLQQLLAQRGTGVLAPYLGVHQRLDRDTSGVVVFTKDPLANPELALAFRSGRVAKTYHALTVPLPRLPAGEWRVVGELGLRGKGKAARIASVPHGGAVAETAFRCLRALPRGFLIEARPRTGRKHQIRVQLAEHGLPILGDDRYGRGREEPGLRVPRLMLHAVSLRLPHPATGREILVRSAYPEDFERVLDALRFAAPGRRAPGRGLC